MGDGENKEAKFEKRVALEFVELLKVMAILRGPGGCPWDQKQNHRSLAPYLLQEAYEALEALESGFREELCEELGDVLLQIVFHAQIAREEETFDMGDVCRSIRDKLEKRHPHVFADSRVESPEEVTRNWEAIKRKEKGDRKSMLDGVSPHQPALLEAFELQSRAAAVGFDWPSIQGAVDKLQEEMEELQEEVDQNWQRAQEEVGDLLFAAVNVARFLGQDGETALRRTNRKFRHRFQKIEEELKQQGKEMEQSSLEEMDAIWENSKEGS